MKKIGWKPVFDAAMLFSLAALYNSRVFGMAFHEAAGLFVCGLLTLHCLFSRKWIAAAIRLHRQGRLSGKTKANLAVNALLAFAFAAILVSGICESQALFPASGKREAWRAVHHFSAGVAAALVGIHLGLHWKLVLNVFRKPAKTPSKPLKAVALCILALWLGFGIFSAFTGGFAELFAAPFRIGASGQPQSPKGDEGKGGYHNGAGGGGNGAEEGKEPQLPKSGEDSREALDKGAGGPGAAAAAFFASALRCVSVMSVFAAIAYCAEKAAPKKRAAPRNG